MNKKSLILNSVVTGLSILMIVALFFPVIEGAETGFYFAFNTFNFLNGNPMTLMIAASFLVTFVVSILMIAIGVLKILRSVNVIKTDKFDKLLRAAGKSLLTLNLALIVSGASYFIMMLHEILSVSTVLLVLNIAALVIFFIANPKPKKVVEKVVIREVVKEEKAEEKEEVVGE